MSMASALLALLLPLQALNVGALVEPAPVRVTGEGFESAPVRITGEGFEFVDEGGPRVGRGALRTYRLEVEPAIGVDVRDFTDTAERILSDERGWTGAGDWSLRRVRRRPDIRVVLATPATVDRLCARAGLDTFGEVSCWNGRFAALNVKRWKRGAHGFVGSVRLYRRYLLNHEVGQ